MKRILFITTNYYPTPDANGICVNEILNVLKEEGLDVHLICYQSSEAPSSFDRNGTSVYGVKMPFYIRLRDYSRKTKNTTLSVFFNNVALFIQRLRILLFFPFYPMTSILSVYKHYKLAADLHKKYKFDIVISSYKSIEGLIASNILKKRNKNLKLVMYVLDSLSNSGRSTFFSENRTGKMGWKWEKRFYKDADLILNLLAHKGHHMQKRYDPFRKKMDYIDIPLLKENKSFQDDTKEKKNINIIYTGTLNSTIRNPRYACEILKEVNVESLQVDFFSQGDTEKLLMEFQKNSNGKIRRNGLISHEESLSRINEASFLLSIGNSMTDMIPSKIFEYMSTGNPIIHIYDNEFDSALPYLKRYPLSILIKKDKDNNNFITNVNLVTQFIKEKTGEKIQFSEIEALYERNRPKYTVEKILNI